MLPLVPVLSVKENTIIYFEVQILPSPTHALTHAHYRPADIDRDHDLDDDDDHGLRGLRGGDAGWGYAVDGTSGAAAATVTAESGRLMSAVSAGVKGLVEGRIAAAKGLRELVSLFETCFLCLFSVLVDDGNGWG